MAENLTSVRETQGSVPRMNMEEEEGEEDERRIRE